MTRAGLNVPPGFTAATGDVFSQFAAIKAQGFDGAAFRQANTGLTPPPASCSAATPG